MSRSVLMNVRTPLVDSNGMITAPWQKYWATLYVRSSLSGVSISFSSTPSFDASVASTFDMTLTGNVTSSTLINTSTGQIITFILAQDSTGGRTFAWPSNVNNATDVSSSANSVTIQSFIARSNGQLYPIGPATYN